MVKSKTRRPLPLLGNTSRASRAPILKPKTGRPNEKPRFGWVRPQCGRQERHWTTAKAIQSKVIESKYLKQEIGGPIGDNQRQLTLHSHTRVMIWHDKTKQITQKNKREKNLSARRSLSLSLSLPPSLSLFPVNVNRKKIELRL